MSGFIDDLLVYFLFVGTYQIALASVSAVVLLSLGRSFTGLAYGWMLSRYALLNLFLLGWGALGSALWAHFTSGRLAVADDAPVWAPFIPIGRGVLDYAAGSSAFWHLLGDTTLPQLQLIWAAIAIPVWILSFASVRLCGSFVQTPAPAP